MGSTDPHQAPLWLWRRYARGGYTGLSQAAMWAAPLGGQNLSSFPCPLWWVFSQLGKRSHERWKQKSVFSVTYSICINSDDDDDVNEKQMTESQGLPGELAPVQRPRSLCCPPWLTAAPYPTPQLSDSLRSCIGLPILITSHLDQQLQSIWPHQLSRARHTAGSQ